MAALPIVPGGRPRLDFIRQSCCGFRAGYLRRREKTYTDQSARNRGSVIVWDGTIVFFVAADEGVVAAGHSFRHLSARAIVNSNCNRGGGANSDSRICGVMS